MGDLAVLQTHKSSTNACFLSAGQEHFGEWPLLSPFHDRVLGYNKNCQSGREAPSCSADSLKIIYPPFRERRDLKMRKKADYGKPTLAK